MRMAFIHDRYLDVAVGSRVHQPNVTWDRQDWKRIKHVLAIHELNVKHADCAAHKLNLSVKSTISSSRPSIEKSLGKCRSIAGHFAGSRGALSRGHLREIQNDLQMPANNIIQDITTRWNYTLAMVERLIQQRRAVEIYFGRHEPNIESLSAAEWRLLKQLIQLLEPADAFTKDMCKEESHLGLQIAGSCMLLKEIEGASAPDLMAEKKLFVKKIESRFDLLEYDRNFGIALFLDSGFKDRCVEKSNEFRRWVKEWLVMEFQPMVEKLLEDHSQAKSVVEKPMVKKPKSLFARQVNISQEENAQRPTTTWKQNLEYEIISYNSEKPIPMQSDPLTYWQKNVVRFPILSKVGFVSTSDFSSK